MWLPSSPHVELMEIFLRYGFDTPRIFNSRYFKDRQYRNSVGLNWPDKKILEHVKKRYGTFKSMKKGYDKNKCKTVPIVVLVEPFWKTRYNVNEEWLGGFEIWNGAGRCAAAYTWGDRDVPCVFAKDVEPGTMKSHLDKKLKGD